MGIMGATGRDFHDFNMVFRASPASKVVAFTTAQIPGMARGVPGPLLATAVEKARHR
jgi:predicted GTPase